MVLVFEGAEGGELCSPPSVTGARCDSVGGTLSGIFPSTN